MAVVGRKGRETSPSKPTPGIESSQCLRGRQEGGGRVQCLARKVPYQAREVQGTKERNNTNSGKGNGAMVEVGRKH